jgi:hypothetical protein
MFEETDCVIAEAMGIIGPGKWVSPIIVGADLQLYYRMREEGVEEVERDFIVANSKNALAYCIHEDMTIFAQVYWDAKKQEVVSKKKTFDLIRGYK